MNQQSLLDEPAKFNRLNVSWVKSRKCRLPESLKDELLMEFEGNRIEFFEVLSKLIERMSTEWSNIRGRTDLSIAEKSIEIKNKYIDLGRNHYEGFIKENAPGSRIVVESTCIFANYIRTLTILQEAIIDYRQQGALGGGVRIEAKLDVSVAGILRYSPFSHESKSHLREVPYSCSSEKINDKVIANVLRTTEEHVQELESKALTFFKNAIGSEFRPSF